MSIYQARFKIKRTTYKQKKRAPSSSLSQAGHDESAPSQSTYGAQSAPSEYGSSSPQCREEYQNLSRHEYQNILCQMAPYQYLCSMNILVQEAFKDEEEDDDEEEEDEEDEEEEEDEKEDDEEEDEEEEDEEEEDEQGNKCRSKNS